MHHRIALALLIAAIGLPAGSHAAGLHFSSTLDTLRADANGSWSLPLRIRNIGTHGLYVGSLWMEVRDRSGSPQRIDFQTLVRGMSAISVGDSSELRVSAPASIEHGTARVQLVAHDGEQKPLRAQLELPISGGELSRHTSRMTRVQGKLVEWVRVPAVASAMPAAGAPGVLLVHGGGARGMLRMALTLSEQGIDVVCVSMPGSGDSEGPADFMGGASVRAVSMALDSLKSNLRSSDRPVAIWGVSRGAAAALLTAAARPGVAAVIAQGALYDLWSIHRRTEGTELDRDLLKEAGSDSAAWRARSPLVSATRIQAHVLVLHGEADEVSPAADARAYVAKRQKLGLPVTEHILAGQRHQMARAIANRTAVAFLKESLGLTGP